ncbi:hypothetical protein U1Q18_030327 [Sarracenia purpurea var. burkii]
MEDAMDRGEHFMVDDLLNFTLDVAYEEEEDDDDHDHRTLKAPSSSSSSVDPSFLNIQDTDDHKILPSLPEIAEEELEWLSNKDAFPALETCLDLLSENPPDVVLNHQSPVSVLENSSSTCTSNGGSTITSCCAGSVLIPVHYPVKARSKRRWRQRRGFSDLSSSQLCWWWSQTKVKNAKQELPRAPPPRTTKIGRRCQHCQAEKTPQWRAGPMGPKTLCNACGVRYKSGRLVPEYRPASSPTFSSKLHSNSHRKIMEMRRQKFPGGMLVNEACGYRESTVVIR